MDASSPFNNDSTFDLHLDTTPTTMRWASCSAGGSPAIVNVTTTCVRSTAVAVASLDPNRWPQDEFQVVGTEVYAHYRHGMGCTKLTNAYFDSRLRTISTARNVRTVGKLIAMTEE